tara:strand:- start:442 stop:1029 length:588 start_codon:yes stop_codon:yes gene_type:complete
MTAITPLEFIHKKGLFGDHHKKNESDLLKVSEIKNLTIIQIAQYKKSKFNINDIKIENLEFPTQSSTVKSNKQTRILWNGPRTWLIISSNEKIKNEIEKNCNDKNFAITDISHSRAVIQIKGSNSKEVLKKGCPLNINYFEKNNCAGSVFHGINIILDCVDNKPHTFNILTLRSFGESLYHHITDSSLEFGYSGI